MEDVVEQINQFLRGVWQDVTPAAWDSNADKRLQFLEAVKVHYVEPMQVTCLNKINNPALAPQYPNIWKNWKAYADCSDKERGQINVRQVMSDEVPLDMESPEQLFKAVALLEEKKLSYKLWATGSRGFHVFLQFPDLLNYPQQVRNAVRNRVIREFGGDITKASEITMLALEYAPHFKTGVCKTLVLERDRGVNGFWFDTQEMLAAYNRIQSQAASPVVPVAIGDAMFKDYHLTDPFFKFLCSTVVPDGQMRNAVPLKNIAIALVLEGLDDSQIASVCAPVIANMPGKGMNEILGWAKKVRANEIREYNPAEIDNWGRMFGYPKFYEDLVGVINIAELMGIKALWYSYCDERAWDVSNWREIFFHSLLGAVVDERSKEWDLRVHLFVLADSTTGKDTYIALVENICEDLNIPMARPVTVTDKSLVGGQDDQARNFNYKNNLKPGMVITAKNGQRLEFKDEVVKGDLFKFRVLAFPEAEIILRKGDYTRSIQSILREAMEGVVDKSVGTQHIKYNTNTTIIMTSYYGTDFHIVENAVHNGLFARALGNFVRMDKETADKLMSNIIKLKFNYKKKWQRDDSPFRAELVKKLRELKEWYDLERDTFLRQWQETDFSDYIQGEVDKLRGEYAHLGEEDYFHLEAVLRRGTEQIHRLAIQHSLITDRLPSKEHYNYAFQLYRHCFLTIVDLVWLENKKLGYVTYREDKYITALTNKLQSCPCMKTMEVHEFLKKLGLKNNSSRDTYLDDLIQRGTIEKIKSPNDARVWMFKLKEVKQDG